MSYVSLFLCHSDLWDRVGEFGGQAEGLLHSGQYAGDRRGWPDGEWPPSDLEPGGMERGGSRQDRASDGHPQCSLHEWRGDGRL